MRQQDDFDIDYGDEESDVAAVPDPQETQRWSYHLGADPYGGAAGAWSKQFYDNPDIDPGAAIQDQIAAFRQQYGDRAPEDDLGVMQMIASGQAPPSQTQTPAQQWAGTATRTTTGRSADALLELLMGRARQGLGVGRDNPQVRAQVDPYAAQQERSMRDYLDTTAEGSRGAPFNMQGERRMAAERLGQATGLFESQVIGREVEARRQEIREALDLWGNLLTEDQRMELAQAELALRQWVAENEDYYVRSGLG